MSFRVTCATTVASVVLLVLPVAAGAPVEPGGIPADLTSTLLHSADVGPVAGPPTRLRHDGRDSPLWSLALAGPVVIILVLTALGITITFRSWHTGARPPRDPFRSWHPGASAHGGRGLAGDMAAHVSTPAKRDASSYKIAVGTATSAAWDPHEVWLSRVKRPRELAAHIERGAP